jgi:2-polyprenyl-3-methyl-5-hydroxy-6-metoxy-1,4-benzoquinol methylase
MSAYRDASPTYPSAYLWPSVLPMIPPGARVFEIGCGNGALVNELTRRGHVALGIDTSESGVEHGGPHCSVASAYDDLRQKFGEFDIVVSLEVVEHLYEPRRFARNALALLKPGGRAIISTPFHGYWKNLALAASGKMDSHFTALWDGGHIKFWSEKTLRQLLEEAGFIAIDFTRSGRFGPFAKSMIAVAHRPK